MASNIPKFASFRPKPKIETISDKSQNSKGHDSSGKQHHKEPDNHARARERENAAKLRLPKKPQETSERDAQRPYYVDRRGDPAILTYGGLNRYDIPPYRRSGYGSVLGLPGGWKIDREQSTDKAIVFLRPGERRKERLLIAKHPFRESSRSYRFVKAADEARALEEQEEYIELPGVRKRKNSAHSQAEEPDYRSLKPASGEQERPDSDLDSEPESGTREVDGAITRRNTELIHRTREKPHDLQAWLDLADHQQAMMTLGRMSVELQRSDRRSLAEVRISTYEQAIRKMGHDEHSQAQLHLRLLTEAYFAWEDKRLNSKWKEVLARYPSRPELWIKYLDFLQSRFADFKYETCCVEFHQCLASFRASQKPVPAEVYLQVILRLTSMMREAGYQELALAIWQGLLEFRLLRMQGTSSTDSSTSLLGPFEEFWDSEVPRIGEANAKGWRSFDVDSHAPVAPASLSLQEEDGSYSVFDMFKIREMDHIENLRHPGRTQDDVGEDDPFHLVLFSDVEPYLNVLPQDTPDIFLVDAFLCFCRMPPLPRPAFEAPKWWLDPFLYNTGLQNPSTSDEASLLVQMFEKYIGGPKRFSMTIELLFDYGFLDSQQIRDLNFLRHALKLLASESPTGEAIGEYLIAFELQYFPSEVTKTAKRLLKARPMSSRLYNAYGLSESRRGNAEKAGQVFQAALTMHNNTGIEASLDLLGSWVWEALGRNDKAGALGRLVSLRGAVRDTSAKPASQPSRPDPTALLRARTLLNEANERALLGHDYRAAVTCTSLLAILGYLSSGDAPDAAFAVHEKLSNWFLQHNLAHCASAELHAQSIAKFLAYHASTAVIVKPALIRTTLEPLIAQFPDNTILLSLYAANESRFAVDDRVRGIMHADILGHDTNKSITQWFFAIHHELQRGEVAGSTSHSVRALFQKAEDDIGAHCPTLWKSHVLFELGETEKERQKRPPKKRRDAKKSRRETRLEESYRRVKEAFFRGLTNLPWCKDYMMLAFTHLQNDVLNEEELRKVYNVMVEKELRIYVDIDLAG
jgi:hypothetical protein